MTPFLFQIRMGTRVFIGRLSHHAREKDVERFFRGYGRIRDIMLKNGYGFVVSSLLCKFLFYVNRNILMGHSMLINQENGLFSMVSDSLLLSQAILTARRAHTSTRWPPGR